MNILLFFVSLVVFVFYISVRFSGEAARINTDKTLANLRPKNKLEKILSEVLVFIGITYGGIYGLFWKKESDALCYRNDRSWIERKINNYGTNKTEEWLIKGFVSGVIKMLDYKKIIKPSKKV